MASNNPVLIICDVPVIHRPKPKRIHKMQYNMSHNNNGLLNNRRLNPGKNSRKNHHENKINKLNNKTSGKISFNLDLISLEEIENDFNEFKSKNEEIEVQKELLNLLRKAKNNNHQKENIRRNFGKFTEMNCPDCKNCELIV